VNTRGGQRLVDLLVVVALAAIGASAYLTWVRADPGRGRAVVELNGYDVTRAPLTMGLASVVALVVLRLAGTGMRRVLSVLITAMGAATVAVALAVRPDGAELARLRPQLSAVLTDHVEVSAGPAPWFALVGGIALLAAGLVGVATAHRWRRPTARYDRDPVVTPEDQWKAIDQGQDPTI
jgi:hypothetical protein